MRDVCSLKDYHKPSHPLVLGSEHTESSAAEAFTLLPTFPNWGHQLY